MTDKLEKFERGWVAGNYANAYGGEDLDESHDNERELELNNDAWYAGYVLGFYSSYALHEVPDEYRERYVGAFQSEAGRLALEAGFIDDLDE